MKKLISICIICSLFIILNTMKAEGNGEAQPSENDYCSINDFEDFHYYLFCNTNINIGTTLKAVNAFIGNESDTMEAGIELYQKFMEPFRTDEHEENMELYYISPDCKLSVTREEPVRGDHMITRWSSFDGKETQNVKEIDSRNRTPFHIIKSENAYTVADGETLYEKVDRLYEQTGYQCVRYNEQGDLVAGYKYEYDESGKSTQTMAVFDLESMQVLWTFYQGKEKQGFVQQIQGDKKSGKVIFNVENRYFYEFTYPSGETRYLGADMYCPCYSPDGKYIAYSSPCSVDWYDVDEKAVEEMERILPGIYILEVETGKTAYIEQDIDAIHRAASLEFRSFQWVEKDCFEQVDLYGK
ncbi:MAG: hypothetical protein NC321_16240 [Clostridium sp.]|nr:hypothetical protein [Clostridium sp.]